jgi:hypothetical protein
MIPHAHAGLNYCWILLPNSYLYALRGNAVRSWKLDKKAKGLPRRRTGKKPLCFPSDLTRTLRDEDQSDFIRSSFHADQNYLDCHHAEAETMVMMYGTGRNDGTYEHQNSKRMADGERGWRANFLMRIFSREHVQATSTVASGSSRNLVPVGLGYTRTVQQQQQQLADDS